MRDLIGRTNAHGRIVEKIGKGGMGEVNRAMISDWIGSKLGPNTSFQRTLTRGGFGPLNSDRWRGAARRANATGVDERPCPAHSAGQQVVRADHRFLASHASVLRLVSSAAQLPSR